MFPRALIPAFALATWISSAALGAPEWQPLFNGTNLDGWKSLLDREGATIDEFVAVEDGVIHVYARNEAPKQVPFGVLMTERSFDRFHLRLEYKWGSKRFEPRANQLRDAGILYHIWKSEKVWPESIECQIQEGDTGDLVFIGAGGVTWMHPRPDRAPEGAGEPAMLPEYGGLPRDFLPRGRIDVIGRYPVHDRATDWNTVEVIAHGASDAIHIVNGVVRSRLFDMRKPLAAGGWAPLESGPIAVQLEGAELFYRNIEIRELPEPLDASSRYVSLSSVAMETPAVQRIEIANSADEPRDAAIEIVGEAPANFKVTGPERIAPGESAAFEVTFAAPFPRGRYSAGLQIGDRESGVFVVLQGLRTEALEGGNEPPLAMVLGALGIAADVGGDSLDHDAAAPTLGSSIAGGWFRALGEVKVTPLARYSPPGDLPFGFQPKSGEAKEIGVLADSGDQRDAHQCLWPPLKGGGKSVTFAAPNEAFALLAQPEGTLSTVPGLSKDAAVPVPARVWPINVFQGRMIENAFLVGFEEATNGDYQDAVFLVENVELVSAED